MTAPTIPTIPTVTELLPQLSRLSILDKIKVIQFLAQELEQVAVNQEDIFSRLSGTWTAKDEAEFLENTKFFRKIETSVLSSELENLIRSESFQEEYSNLEDLLKDALLNLLESKRRKSLAQRVNSLFEKTNSLPHLQEITDDDIAVEIDAYRSGQ
jgi:antitoxin ParD1/3/4